MIRTQYLGGQKTTTRSVCRNYFGEDATYETNIDCALVGQSDFARLHACTCADTNTCTQRDTVAHRYPYQHAHGDSHCYTNEYSHQHTNNDAYPNTHQHTGSFSLCEVLL
jgi:hypothetical protein